MAALAAGARRLLPRRGGHRPGRRRRRVRQPPALREPRLLAQPRPRGRQRLGLHARRARDGRPRLSFLSDPEGDPLTFRIVSVSNGHRAPLRRRPLRRASCRPRATRGDAGFVLSPTTATRSPPRRTSWCTSAPRRSSGSTSAQRRPELALGNLLHPVVIGDFADQTRRRAAVLVLHARLHRRAVARVIRNQTVAGAQEGFAALVATRGTITGATALVVGTPNHFDHIQLVTGLNVYPLAVTLVPLTGYKQISVGVDGRDVDERRPLLRRQLVRRRGRRRRADARPRAGQADVTVVFEGAEFVIRRQRAGAGGDAGSDRREGGAMPRPTAPCSRSARTRSTSTRDVSFRRSPTRCRWWCPDGFQTPRLATHRIRRQQARRARAARDPRARLGAGRQAAVPDALRPDPGRERRAARRLVAGRGRDRRRRPHRADEQPAVAGRQAPQVSTRSRDPPRPASRSCAGSSRSTSRSASSRSAATLSGVMATFSPFMAVSINVSSVRSSRSRPTACRSRATSTCTSARASVTNVSVTLARSPTLDAAGADDRRRALRVADRSGGGPPVASSTASSSPAAASLSSQLPRSGISRARVPAAPVGPFTLSRTACSELAVSIPQQVISGLAEVTSSAPTDPVAIDPQTLQPIQVQQHLREQPPEAAGERGLRGRRARTAASELRSRQPRRPCSPPRSTSSPREPVRRRPGLAAAARRADPRRPAVGPGKPAFDQRSLDGADRRPHARLRHAHDQTPGPVGSVGVVDMLAMQQVDAIPGNCTCDLPRRRRPDLAADGALPFWIVTTSSASTRTSRTSATTAAGSGNGRIYVIDIDPKSPTSIERPDPHDRGRQRGPRPAADRGGRRRQAAVRDRAEPRRIRAGAARRLEHELLARREHRRQPTAASPTGEPASLRRADREVRTASPGRRPGDIRGADDR